MQSGPETGAYHIVEGPNSWTDQDNRKNISKEHQNDWNQNIAPLTTERGYSTYFVYREDLSTVPLTDYSDKIVINHVYLKPGYGDQVEEMVKNFKKVWEAVKQTVAVYEVASSGTPQFTFVTRYAQGLKEREKGFRASFKDRYTAAYSEDGYQKYMEGVRNGIEKTWSELLFYRADLSSK